MGSYQEHLAELRRKGLIKIDIPTKLQTAQAPKPNKAVQTMSRIQPTRTNDVVKETAKQIKLKGNEQELKRKQMQEQAVKHKQNLTRNAKAAFERGEGFGLEVTGDIKETQRRKKREADAINGIDTADGSMRTMLPIIHAWACYIGLAKMRLKMFDDGVKGRLRLSDGREYTSPLFGTPPPNSLARDLYKTAQDFFYDHFKNPMMRNALRDTAESEPWKQANFTPEVYAPHATFKPKNWDMEELFTGFKVGTDLTFAESIPVDDLAANKVFLRDTTYIRYSPKWGDHNWWNASRVWGQPLPGLFPFMFGVDPQKMEISGGLIRWTSESAKAFTWAVAEGGDLPTLPDAVKGQRFNTRSNRKGNAGRRVYYRAHVPLATKAKTWLDVFSAEYNKSVDFYTKLAIFIIRNHMTDRYQRYSFKLNDKERREFLKLLALVPEENRSIDGTTLRGYVD